MGAQGPSRNLRTRSVDAFPFDLDACRVRRIAVATYRMSMLPEP
jgi:hypothetical protein